MGGNDSSEDVTPTLSNGEIQKYRRLHPNLSEQEINEIYGIFSSQNPDEGYVKVRSILGMYSGTQELSSLRQEFIHYDKVDFDQFLSVIGKNQGDKKQNFQNVEFESNIKDVTCFICPVQSSN